MAVGHEPATMLLHIGVSCNRYPTGNMLYSCVLMGRYCGVTHRLLRLAVMGAKADTILQVTFDVLGYTEVGHCDMTFHISKLLCSINMVCSMSWLGHQTVYG